MTPEAFRIRQGQHNNKSLLDVGFDFWFCNVKVFVIMEFVYVQVNGTEEYVQDTTVVVLKVSFPYGFIYEMGTQMS